jgi:hypothetical protein
MWELVVDVGASSSSFPGNGARKELDGAKLTREVFFNLWKYSSLVPGNGARKELDVYACVYSYRQCWASKCRGL